MVSFAHKGLRKAIAINHAESMGAHSDGLAHTTTEADRVIAAQAAAAASEGKKIRGRMNTLYSGDLPPRTAEQTDSERIAQLKRVKATRTIATVTQAHELANLQLRVRLAKKQVVLDRKAAALAKQQDATSTKR